jgi:Protein of unknown function (DUF3079)
VATKKFPVHPANPERQCWGCDKYCAAKDMTCGNGSDRTQHPFELVGEDWQSWGTDDAVGSALTEHLVLHQEVLPGIGNELAVSGVIHRFDTDDLADERGIVRMDVFDKM